MQHNLSLAEQNGLWFSQSEVVLLSNPRMRLKCSKEWPGTWTCISWDYKQPMGIVSSFRSHEMCCIWK